jgi:hypothetical protein
MKLGFCKLKESPGRAEPRDASHVQQQILEFVDKVSI